MGILIAFVIGSIAFVLITMGIDYMHFSEIVDAYLRMGTAIVSICLGMWVASDLAD